MFSLFRKKALLPDDAQAQIVACIRDAESKTSGELRIYMESRCKYVDPLERAKEIFTILGMEKTVERNAIIIYIAMDDRQFALFGDKVIYEKAGGASFWAGAAQTLSMHLAKGEVTAGLCNCIRQLGGQLADHFPYDPSINKNELPDEIVFGK